MDLATIFHDSLLNEKQAADNLGVATATLRKSRCTGTLFGLTAPAFLKLGRSIRYKASVLKQFTDSLDQYSIDFEGGQ